MRGCKCPQRPFTSGDCACQGDLIEASKTSWLGDHCRYCFDDIFGQLEKGYSEVLAEADTKGPIVSKIDTLNPLILSCKSLMYFRSICANLVTKLIDAVVQCAYSVIADACILQWQPLNRTKTIIDLMIQPVTASQVQLVASRSHTLESFNLIPK